MNETYWVVVSKAGNVLTHTISIGRSVAIDKYVGNYDSALTDGEINQIWEERDARCIKVRLVPVEE